MPSDASALGADPRLGPYALILFMAVLFNVLFCYGYFMRAKLREAARDKARAIIQEAAGITNLRRTTAVTGSLACAGITAFFCIPYATIYMAISRPLGAARSSAGGSLAAWLPWVLLAAFLVVVLKQVAAKRTTLGIVQYLGRADYEGALSRTEQFLKWFPHSGQFLSLRGAILLLSGKLTEAEGALREGLETGRIAVLQGRGRRVLSAASAQTTMLVNLGHVLLTEGRRRDAAAAFEGAAKLMPVAWGAYNGLAEVCLVHDSEPRRALDFADQALQLRAAHDVAPDQDRHVLAYMWANRARALALLGRADEANASLDHAAQEGDPTFVPGVAGTLWRSGLALLQMDRETEAVLRFKRAQQIDQDGLYGRLAAAALREHRVRV